MSREIIEDFLAESIGGFRNYKKLAERAMAQVSDEEFFQTIDAEANSIATIAKHIGGNLRSRWRDFLTTDGEKADRNRDSEFVADGGDTRESIMQLWKTGFEILFDSLEALKPEDLNRTVKIRGEDFTVVKAITRSALHAASHIGQIQFLAKHLRAAEWETLSIPKNKSAEFNDWLSKSEDKGNYLEASQKFTEKDLK